MNGRNLGWPCSGLSPLIPKVLLFTKILFINIDWMASASRLMLFPRLAAFRLRNVIACFNFRTSSTPAANSSGFLACAPLPISLSFLLDPACALLLLDCQGTSISGFRFFVAYGKINVGSGLQFKPAIKPWSLFSANVLYFLR